MENPPVFPEGWPSNSHLLTARPFHKQNLSPMRKKSLRPSPAQSALSQYITIITAWCINNAFLNCVFHWWLFGYSILPLFILIPKWFQGFGASFQDSFWMLLVGKSRLGQSTRICCPCLSNAKGFQNNTFKTFQVRYKCSLQLGIRGTATNLIKVDNLQTSMMETRTNNQTGSCSLVTLLN